MHERKAGSGRQGKTTSEINSFLYIIRTVGMDKYNNVFTYIQTPSTHTEHSTLPSMRFGQ